MRKFTNKRGEFDGFAYWLLFVIYVWVVFGIGNKNNEILTAIRNLSNEQQTQVSNLQQQLRATNYTIEELKQKLNRATDHQVEK